MAGIGRPATCACGSCAKCKHRSYMRQYEAARPGRAADYQRERRKSGGPAEYERERWHNDPEYRRRKAARNATQGALRRGALVRQACEVCGSDSAEAHHDDYDRPLDVRWLCRAHHAAHHNAERRAA